MQEIPTIQDAVVAAEKARVERDFPRAIQIASLFADESPEAISAEAFRPSMQLWRIWTVAATGWANAQRNGNIAADHLIEAKEVIHTYYNHARTQREARAMDREQQGTEYQMASEMARDKGKYNIAAFGLTGNPGFLSAAVEDFSNAVALATPGSSADGLARMERFSAERRLGRTRPNFAEVVQGYTQVRHNAAGGADRQRAASWMLAGEAFATGHIFRGLQGVGHFVSITVNPLELVSYIGQKIQTGRLERQRRRTYTGNPQTLAL